MLYIDSPMGLPVASRVLLYGAGGRGEKFLGLLREQRPDVSVLGFLDTFKSGMLGIYPVTRFPLHRYESDVHIVVCSTRADAIAKTLEDAGVENYFVYIDSKPKKIGVLDITTNCNAKCIFCSLVNNPTRTRGPDWDMDHFDRAMSNLGDVDEICFCCSCGEPLLNKFLPDMLKKCKKLNKETSFYTNGAALVDSGRIRTILEHADRMYLSFVSPRQEVQDRFMKQVRVEEVKANLHFVASLPNPPKLLMNVLVMRENITHLTEIVDFAARAGAAQVVFTLMRQEGLSQLENFVLGKPSPEERRLWGEEVARAKERYGSGPMGVHISANLEILVQEASGDISDGDCPEGAPVCPTGEDAEYTRLCLLPWTQNTIYFDGTASPCCTTRHTFGNAFADQGSLFEGSAHERLRQALLSGKLYGPCRTCEINPLGKRSALVHLLGYRGFLIPGITAPPAGGETIHASPNT